MPSSVLIRDKKDKKHIFYLRSEDAFYFGKEYTIQRNDETVIEFIERTISMLYQQKIIGVITESNDTESLGMRTPNISEGTKEPEGLLGCENTLLPPIPIPEGHVRVQLHFKGFDGCVWALFPARINRKDSINIDDLIIPEGELTTKTLNAIRDECMHCVDIEWQRDDEGFYQVVLLSL